MHLGTRSADEPAEPLDARLRGHDEVPKVGRMCQMITFDTEPARYRHSRLACEGTVATLTLDVAEEGGLVPGYRLKLNSYDLGVDIELADGLNRIRC
jgi:hypothetical protein